MAKFNDFQWEDEEESSQKDKNESTSDFASLLAGENLEFLQLQQGEQVSGTIVTIPKESNDVLIELSPSQTGVIDKQDILEEDGSLSKAVGDRIVAYVISLTDGIQLSSTLGKSQQAERDLEMAQSHRLPVKGKVTKDIKGGFEVSIFGKSAFCPVSQMDTKFIENKADYLNKEFEFLITKLENKGRNIVVSREQLLKDQAAERIQAIKASIQQDKDQILEGTITQLRDYGAFVDLGGIDGFLHISEISYARVERPGDILSPGERVRVKVLSVEEKDQKTRISLSMRAVAQDPWTIVHDEYKELESYKGRVIRISKHGAFVELKPGLDGLIHLSEMSWEKRIYDASEVVSVGDEVTVRIIEIDDEKRRISLSLKDKEQDPWKKVSELQGQTINGKVEKLKGFGAIIQIIPGISGLLPLKTLRSVHGETYRKVASPPKMIEVTITEVNLEEKKVLLSLPQAKDEDDGEDYKEYIKQKRETNQDKLQDAQGSFGKLLAEKLKGKV